MSYFMVTYDLTQRASEWRYQELTDQIEKFPSLHTQDSVWLVDYSGTAGQLYSVLRAHMHKDDRLLVLEYFKNSSWMSKSFKGTNDWLTSRCGASS